MSYAPHLVVDGAALAAHAVGATRVVLCLERGTGLAERLAREIDQRRRGPVRWQFAEVPAGTWPARSPPWSTSSTAARRGPRCRPGHSSGAWMGGRPWWTTWRRSPTWR